MSGREGAALIGLGPGSYHPALWRRHRDGCHRTEPECETGHSEARLMDAAERRDAAPVGATGGVPDMLRAACAVVAVALPTLVAFNVAPSATFFNQAAAFVGWGAFLLVLATSLPPSA